MSLSLEMQYKCVFIIITQRYSVALGIERQPMSMSYAEAGGGGSSHLDSESSFRSSCVPWFSRGLVLLAPRRKTRSGPPGCAWRSDTLDAPLAYRHQGQDPLGVERDRLVGLRHGLEQLVQAHRQPSSICHRCRQLTTLHLLFMVQYQLVSFFLSTHVLRSTARAHPHGTVCLFVCATIEPLDGVRRTGRERRRIAVRQAGRAFAKQPWDAYLSWQLSH